MGEMLQLGHGSARGHETPSPMAHLICLQALGKLSPRALADVYR